VTLLERNLGQADNGIAFYKRALEVDPYYLPTLEALERIYEEQANHPELVTVLAAKVKALTDPEAIATHKLRMGSLFETSLSNLEKAAQTYQEVLDLDPANLAGLRGLERVHGQLNHWPELVKVLEQQLDVVETERDRVEVLLKLANIQEEQFLKPELAAVRLEQAIENRCVGNERLRIVGALLPTAQAVARPRQYLRATHQRESGAGGERYASTLPLRRSTRTRWVT